jgi:hypothetical protein
MFARIAKAARGLSFSDPVPGCPARRPRRYAHMSPPYRAARPVAPPPRLGRRDFASPLPPEAEDPHLGEIGVELFFDENGLPDRSRPPELVTDGARQDRRLC